jgi:hypothetical protein
VTFFVVWLLALGLLAGAPAGRTVMRIPFTATFALYLFGSALVLGLRHPARWLLGTAGVLFLIGMFTDVMSRPHDAEWRYVPASGAFFSALADTHGVWQPLPMLAQWAISTFVMFGAGFAALWAAASRHRDHRRHPRRHG